MSPVSYIHVSYPAPEAYFIVPAEWNVQDLTVKYGALYYKGNPTFIRPHDFVSGKEVIEVIDENHMEWMDIQEFLR